MNIDLRQGDCLDVLKELSDNSVDAVVTDPPYGLSFMGKAWDKTVPSVEVWAECLRVLKPGGHIVAFFGTRTYHRGAVAIEDAGFEVRDMMQWVYASGFPKSQNIGKAYDKKMGNERKVIGTEKVDIGMQSGSMHSGRSVNVVERDKTKGTSPYEGQGTALKPSHEPIVLARKPLSEKTIVDNVVKWGTGGIEIDGCRVPVEGGWEKERGAAWLRSGHGKANNELQSISGKERNGVYVSDKGRFPANTLVTDDALNDGEVTKGKKPFKKKTNFNFRVGEDDSGQKYESQSGLGDVGSKSRFFDIDVWAEKHGLLQYPKAAKKERFTYLHCNCETVKLEAWQKQDQNLNEKMGGMSPEADTSEKQSMDGSHFNMSTTGNESMDQSQKDIHSTTSTTTNKTTDLKTSNLLPQQNTSEYTQDAKSETESGGSPAQSAKNTNQSPLNTGTSHQKGGHCTGVAVPATSAGLYIKSVCVNCGSEVKSDGHPTQKPLHLMSYLVRLTSQEGMTVLDPFMGSGTTGVACKQLNRNFIGIELDVDYYNIAKARIGV